MNTSLLERSEDDALAEGYGSVSKSFMYDDEKFPLMRGYEDDVEICSNNFSNSS
jgi:hypothetical protein